MSSTPAPIAEFIAVSLPLLERDPRIVGVAAGGSWVRGDMDEFSDLDLVIAVGPPHAQAVLSEGIEIAGSLGPLLSAFTGDHVGEPRLVICFYGLPALHVDLKFVSLDDLAIRVEDPVVLWERDALMSTALLRQQAVYPALNLQWIEDRFWVWIHYGAAKIGRGELFEAIGFLAYLRETVLGPMCSLRHGATARGVRKLEALPAAVVTALAGTVPDYTRASCGECLRKSAQIYQACRNDIAPAGLTCRTDAQNVALTYLDTILKRDIVLDHTTMFRESA